MGGEPRVYKVRKIRDLLRIPDDRLNDFFVELADGIRRIRDGGLPAEAIEVFTWTDDGKREITARWTGPLKWVAQRIYGDPNRLIAEGAATQAPPQPGPDDIRAAYNTLRGLVAAGGLSERDRSGAEAGIRVLEDAFWRAVEGEDGGEETR